MDSIDHKVEHVRSAEQIRSHQCHWPGCKLQVPPAKWGCKKHWYSLPKDLRDLIWRTYRIGQEETGNVSQAYLSAARKVEKWIKENCQIQESLL